MLPFLETQHYTASFMARILGSALVTNAAGTVVKSTFTLNSKACFTIVSAPENHGKVNFNGSDKSFALLLNPQNFADADTLTISGGAAMVLGGVNAGTIKSTTTKSLEVYGVNNSGNLDVKNSQGIVIADVQNNGGTITVDNIGVTLINVKNTGKVVATGPKGKYNAYNIVNSGSINIAEGLIDLHFSDNTGGTVTIGDKVTGKISYDGGKGTITAPSGVTVTDPAKAPTKPTPAKPTVAKKVTSTGKVEVKMSKADAVALTSKPTAKIAFASAIAKTINVNATDVTILGIYVDGVKIGRRLANHSTDSTVRVDWKATATVAITAKAMDPKNLVTNIVAEAKEKAGVDIVITEVASLTVEAQPKDQDIAATSGASAVYLGNIVLMCILLWFGLV